MIIVLICLIIPTLHNSGTLWNSQHINVLFNYRIVQYFVNMLRLHVDLEKRAKSMSWTFPGHSFWAAHNHLLRHTQLMSVTCVLGVDVCVLRSRASLMNDLWLTTQCDFALFPLIPFGVRRRGVWAVTETGIRIKVEQNRLGVWRTSLLSCGVVNILILILNWTMLNLVLLTVVRSETL